MDTRNLEGTMRPAAALSVGVMMPLVGVFAPFIVLGIALFLAYAFAGWTWGAAMLPLSDTDELLDELLTSTYGANSAIWGAFALIAGSYAAIAGWGWYRRGRPFRNLRLAAGLIAAYAVFVAGAGAVLGTHFPSQVAFAWNHPGRSATKTWNCPARVADGSAQAEGRYDFFNCLGYADHATVLNGCRQVMRRLAPLSGPAIWCSNPISEITGHVWPKEGVTYKEWDTSFIKPYRNKPEATPAIMRQLLAKEGLTPLP